MDRGVNEEGVLGRFSVSSQYDYTTDAAGRRTEIARSGTAMTEARADAYGYNARSELTSAAKLGGPGSVPADEYAYQYDDIGNRITSTDLGTNRTYTANFLNQYTLISNLCDSVTLCDDFVPQYDLDGNQTLVKTSTGVWQVSYNGENRPVLWTCGTTNIVMAFDRMGRRVLSRETVGGAVTDSNFSFVYDGYLCIQRLNATTKNVKLIFTWDPLEKVATRPLMVEKPGKYKMHVTHDGNKNVSELVFFSGGSGIAAHYEYAPFGAVTASTRSTSVTAYDFRTYNPFRFSSEYADDTLGLVYYNYRHYNPLDARWTSRDPLEEWGGSGLYSFSPIDYLGLVHVSYGGDGNDAGTQYKGVISGLGYAFDWGLSWSLSLDVEETLDRCEFALKGTFALSAEVGITGGFATMKNFMGYDVWLLAGIRGFAGVEASTSFGVKVNKCEPAQWGTSLSASGYIGAEAGFMARYSRRGAYNWKELGVGVRARASFGTSAEMHCQGDDCSVDGSLGVQPFEAEIFARLGWFNVSWDISDALNTRIDTSRLRTEYHFDFPNPIGAMLK